jgi:hypothetical protein
VAKTTQIQLRVSPAEKAELVRRARSEGLDLSAYMLGRLLPRPGLRFLALIRLLGEKTSSAPVLAELHDLLARADRAELRSLVENGPSSRLSPLQENQLAAMVETRAAQLGTEPPAWVGTVKGLSKPWFASELLSLRLHLLTQSPPAFRQRNLFVDATIGSRA